MEAEFLKGIAFRLPHQKAPSYVKGSISIKREELLTELLNRNEEWINLDCKVSPKGVAYLQINNWKPTKKEDIEF